MSQSDPTDHALAAIASILDQSGAHREPEKPAIPEEPVLEESPIVPGSIEADGYSRVGPGPMEAIRFKWTVRRADNDEYYVDETIGENSRPVVSGPMTSEAAIRFVDDRESETRRRFDVLKGEMAGPDPTAVNFARRASGEM